MNPSLEETIAAVALQFGVSAFRQKATAALNQLSDIYRIAASAASELLQASQEEPNTWGDENDWVLVTQNFADRILEFMAKRKEVPSLEHIRELAKESLYRFLEPKIPGEMRDEKKLKLIRDLLTSALEGGSNYWYTVTGQTLPQGTAKKDFQKGGKMQPPNDYYHPYEIIPTVPGGSLMIADKETGEEFKLDLPNLEKGLGLFQQRYPERYTKASVDEDYDADDGDLFLQLALFGKQVFG